MPTYEYACRDCGHHLEAVQSFSDDPLTECPECGGRLRKKFSAAGIIFKGSGYYVTDSRAQSKSDAKAGSSSSDGAAGSGSSDSKASEPAGSGTSGGSKTNGSKSGGSQSSGSGASGSGASGSGASGSGAD